MKYPKNGFTLIELLVVVLIIGILAGIALPKYTTAVEKSRVSEVLVLFRSIEQGERMYMLNNGRYTRNLDQLEIKIPAQLQNNGYGNNHWSTQNFSYWTDAEGFGWNSKIFKAKATPKSQKFKIYMELTDGDTIVWCGPYSTANWPARPDASGIPSICKAIAGNPDGIISQS